MQLSRNPALFFLNKTPLLLAGLLSLAACGGSSSGPPQTAASPRISFDVARQSLGSENGAEAPILLRVEAPGDDGLPFDVAVVVDIAPESTAIAGVDVDPLPTSPVLIPAGTMSGTYPALIVRALADQLFDGVKTLELELRSDDPRVEIGAYAEHSIHIADEDALYCLTLRGMDAIDPATGAVQQVARTDRAPFGFAGDAAWDSMRGVLYTRNEVTNELIRVDLDREQAEVVGLLPFGTKLENFAYDSKRDLLYASSGPNTMSTQVIYRVDVETAVAQSMSSLFSGPIQALSYIPSQDTIYYVTSGRLYRRMLSAPQIPPILVGQLSVGVSDLAFDPVLERLYATTGADLYLINQASASAALIGAHGEQVVGITYDTAGDRLLAVEYFSEISQCDVSTGVTTLLTRIDSGSGSLIAAHPSGAFAFALSPTTGALDRVDLRSGARSRLSLTTAGLGALTWDPSREQLLGFDPSSQALVTIDPETGVSGLVGVVNVVNADIVALAFSGPSALFGIDQSSGQLIRISPENGISQPLGNLGLQDPTGLVADKTSLWVLDGASGELWALDPETMLRSQGVAVHFAQIEPIAGLTCATESGLIWASGLSTFFKVEPTTGVCESIGPCTAIWNLARDIDAAITYAALKDVLCTLDMTTGSAKSLTLLDQAVTTLTFDTVQRQLLATAGGDLFALQPATGSTSLIGSLGIAGATTLTFDPVGGVLYGCETGTDSLHQIDILTGNASPVTGITLPGVGSLAFDSASGRLIVKVFSSIYFAPLGNQATQQITGSVQISGSEITALK